MSAPPYRRLIVDTFLKHRLPLIALAVWAAACSRSPTSVTPVAATSTPEQPAPSAPLEPKEAGQWFDLAYASTSDAQKLDLYVPAGAGPFPLIVYIHGGGFRSGDKELPADRGLLEFYLARGYAVASLNYRLSGEASFPAAVQDVKTAVRWLRAHAAGYRIDPDRFAAWGVSAGANLAAMLGTSCGIEDLEGIELGAADQSSCVQAVVDFFGPIDFLQMDDQFESTDCPQIHNMPTSPESRYLAGAVPEMVILAQAANPISYITADDPPFFIEHGTADCTVPYQQSQLLHDALAPAIGQENVVLVLLDGAEHGDPEFLTLRNLATVREFLDTHLR